MKLNEIKQLNEFYTAQDKEQILELLNQLRITNFNIGDNGSVTVIGDVDIDGHSDQEEIFQIKWNRIIGDFSCNQNVLNGLNFAPVSCNTFGASENYLTTFKDVPIAHTLYLEDNEITDFTDMKKNTYNTVWLYNNPIETLVGVHEHLSFKSGGELYMDFSKITSGGIGLVLIENFLSIANCAVGYTSNPLPPPFHIINRYLGRPDDLFACQAELIEAGYEAFAQL